MKYGILMSVGMQEIRFCRCGKYHLPISLVMDGKLIDRKFDLTICTSVLNHVHNILGFPGGSAVKNPPANAGDVGLIPGLGRSPGGGNGNPLQYSWLKNHTDRGA